MNIFNPHQRERFVDEDLLMSKRIFMTPGLHGPDAMPPVDDMGGVETKGEKPDETEADKPKSFEDLQKEAGEKVKKLTEQYQKSEEKITDQEKKVIDAYKAKIDAINKKYEGLKNPEEGAEQLKADVSKLIESIVKTLKAETIPDPDSLPGLSEEDKETVKKAKSELSSKLEELTDKLAPILQLIGMLKKALAQQPPDLDTLKDAMDDISQKPPRNPADVMKQNRENYAKMLSAKPQSFSDLIKAFNEPRGDVATAMFNQENAKGVEGIPEDQISDIGRYMNEVKPAIQQYLVDKSEMRSINSMQKNADTNLIEISGYNKEGQQITIEMSLDGTEARIKPPAPKEGEEPKAAPFGKIEDLNIFNDLLSAEAPKVASTETQPPKPDDTPPAEPEKADESTGEEPKTPAPKPDEQAETVAENAAIAKLNEFMRDQTPEEQIKTLQKILILGTDIDVDLETNNSKDILMEQIKKIDPQAIEDYISMVTEPHEVDLNDPIDVSYAIKELKNTDKDAWEQFKKDYAGKGKLSANAFQQQWLSDYQARQTEADEPKPETPEPAVATAPEAKPETEPPVASVEGVKKDLIVTDEKIAELVKGIDQSIEEKDFVREMQEEKHSPAIVNRALFYKRQQGLDEKAAIDKAYTDSGEERPA